MKERFFWFGMGIATYNILATLIPAIVLPWFAAPVVLIALVIKLIS